MPTRFQPPLCGRWVIGEAEPVKPGRFRSSRDSADT